MGNIHLSMLQDKIRRLEKQLMGGNNMNGIWIRSMWKDRLVFVTQFIIRQDSISGIFCLDGYDIAGKLCELSWYSKKSDAHDVLNAIMASINNGERVVIVETDNVTTNTVDTTEYDNAKSLLNEFGIDV